MATCPLGGGTTERRCADVNFTSAGRQRLPASRPRLPASSTRLGRGLRRLGPIQATGATLRLLPPYSPDFNPIENAFAKLKATLRGAAARTITMTGGRCRCSAQRKAGGDEPNTDCRGMAEEIAGRLPHDHAIGWFSRSMEKAAILRWSREANLSPRIEEVIAEWEDER